MSDLPTRNKAHAYLNHLRDIRGDLCIESCVHSIATNTAEHCLEAYVDGRLIDRQVIVDAWNEPHVADSVRLINSKFADVIKDALTKEKL